jgi:hypothetical protein
MNRRTALKTAGLGALAFARIGRAARCTTSLDPRVVHEYEGYLSAADEARLGRFDAGELSWIPDPARGGAESALREGRSIRRNIALGRAAERFADLNGAVIHWVGAIRIDGAGLDDLKGVLQDYGRYPEIYSPLIYECRAQPAADTAGTAYEVMFGLQNVYRVASFFPQHYSFRIKSRSTYSQHTGKAGPALAVHWRAHEIQESQSGVPGRNDFLDPDQTHGVLWAFNTYWLARRKGPNLYVEFESITLARSVRNFSCRIGIVPVPKAIVANVMESLPAESLDLMLAATKVECERRIVKL